MILVLLLCLLSNLQAYPVQQEWIVSGDAILDQLTMDMFGCNVEELFVQKPHIWKDRSQEMISFWQTVDTRFVMQDTLVVGVFDELEFSGANMKEEIKNRLANIFDGLSPQQQKEWILVFPYARQIGKLSRLQKGLPSEEYYYPPESDAILDQLAKDMFGCNVEELYEQQPDVVWAFNELKLRGSAVKEDIKNTLVDTFCGLNPQEQEQWILVFPYAKHIEKLAKMRKKNTQPVPI